MRKSKVFGTFISLVLLALTSQLLAEARDPSAKKSAQRIDRTLASLVGHHRKPQLPRVLIIESPFPQAFAKEGKTVVISTALAGFAENRHELAFVLAHEMGHLALHAGTPVRSFISGSEKNEQNLAREFEADQYALDLLKSRGFNPRHGAKILKRLGSFGEEQGFPMALAFPSLMSRVKFIESIRRPIRLKTPQRG